MFDWLFDVGTDKDSRPYQEAVKVTALNSGLTECDILFVMDMASHVDPTVIEQMYGQQVAQACRKLQEYNSER